MAKAHTLVDNFNDDALNAARWYSFGSPAPLAERLREVNGRIEIRPASGTTGYSGIGSVASYDLTGSEVRVELVRALSPAVGGAETYLRASNGADYAGIIVSDGLLSCVTRISGVFTYFGEQPYAPALHRWLRLRERDGLLHWEVSADGNAWTVLASRTTPFALTALVFELAAGTHAALPSPGMAVWDSVNTPATSPSRRVEERRLSALEVREAAADVAAGRRYDEHVNNNDETNYPTFTGRELAGMYSKSLRHDTLGDPEPVSYASLLRALESRDPQDFEEVVLASSTALKLTNPQAGLAFDVEGPDAQERTMPPAPRFDSEVTAHEMGELYWMAVARDVPFTSYAADAATASTIVKRAIDSLNAEFPRFGGTVPVTAQNLFRGIYPGEQVGPYVSQFLLKGNNDSRKPDGQGRDANEGFISYGSHTIDQRIFPASANVDYLTAFTPWLEAQNGVDKRGQDTFDTVKRFIRTLRDGATYVHFD